MNKTSDPNIDRVHRALTSFGLSENEITIYTQALKHTENSPSTLAKTTHIPRTTIYDILEDLSQKGLIEIKRSQGMQKQQTKVTAKNPAILQELLQDRRESIAHTQADITQILPFLQGDYIKHHQSADFQYYPGIEGVKQVYFSHLHQNHLPVAAWENIMSPSVFGNKAARLFTHKNAHKTKDYREIIPLNSKVKQRLSALLAQNPHHIIARQMRFVDDPVFDNKLSIAMQGNRLYIACANQDETYGLIIKSQTLAYTMTSIFELQWLQAIPLTQEIIKSWGNI